MGSLFIAGNGFDIAHGIPTQYKNFREYLIEAYPEANKYKDSEILLSNIMYNSVIGTAVELLLHTMDRAAGVDWNDFENALAYIDFSDKLPLPNHRDKESFEEDQNLMQKYLIYTGLLTEGLIYSSKQWPGLFEKWISNIQRGIHQKQYLPKDSLKKIFETESEMYFLNFNYTATLRELYGIKKVTHIHNSLGQKLIIGHGREEVSYPMLATDELERFFVGGDSLDKMLLSFKKDTEKQLVKKKDFFDKIDESIDKVYSYGFSYSDVDSVYIKKIIEKISPDGIWLFTSFEFADIESLEKKKRALISYGFKGTFGMFE